MSKSKRSKLPSRRAKSRAARLTVAAQRIAMHRKVIEGTEKKRSLMGDSWADRTIAYHREAIRSLGGRA